MIDKSRLRLHGHLPIKKNEWFMDQLEDAQSFDDPEEWRIDKSFLRFAWSFADQEGWMIDDGSV